jgi:hypothetical protein
MDNNFDLKLKLRVIALEGRMRSIESTQDQILKKLEKLDEIYDIMAQARGGWRVLLAVGAMATGIAVFVSAVLRILGHR